MTRNKVTNGNQFLFDDDLKGRERLVRVNLSQKGTFTFEKNIDFFLAMLSNTAVRRIFNSRDENVTNLAAAFYGLASFDFITQALQWKHNKTFTSVFEENIAQSISVAEYDACRLCNRTLSHCLVLDQFLAYLFVATN